jgi:hypothetical protein
MAGPIQPQAAPPNILATRMTFQSLATIPRMMACLLDPVDSLTYEQHGRQQRKHGKASAKIVDHKWRRELEDKLGDPLHTSPQGDMLCLQLDRSVGSDRRTELVDETGIRDNVAESRDAVTGVPACQIQHNITTHIPPRETAPPVSKSLQKVRTACPGVRWAKCEVMTEPVSAPSCSSTELSNFSSSMAEIAGASACDIVVQRVLDEMRWRCEE